MSLKNTKNTLARAEWQSFGISDIEKSLVRGGALDSSAKTKAERAFKELQDFAKEKENQKFINFYGANQLKAQNFVGLIQTKSGFCLEILPKIFRDDIKLSQAESMQKEPSENSKNSADSAISPESKNTESKNIESKDKDSASPTLQARTLLINLLKSLRDSPFKQSNIASLHTQNMPLLEVFVRMFLGELDRLIKRGIKSDYILEEENRLFLKGKLLFSENLKYNFAHKERFFTQSDEYSPNIAPNRIISSTLALLSTQNFSSETSRILNQMRFIFADIPPSRHLESDFAKSHQNANLRQFDAYQNILAWCAIFLRHHSPTPYNGVHKAFALLFDMNELFESFVAQELKKYSKNTDFYIKTQENSKYLITHNGKNKFNMRPDIVLYKKEETQNKNIIAIADTKWKMLDFARADSGILQADLYQLFAYLAKYEAHHGIIIYPRIDEVREICYKYRAHIYTSAPTESSANADSSAESKADAKSSAQDSSHKNQPSLTIAFFDVRAWSEPDTLHKNHEKYQIAQDATSDFAEKYLKILEIL